ncbi:MAG: hypothetical protein FRX48_09814 [Lasallia pustulata]|uniref:Uncharacterized protein n=1 Tax=Lasallia pustulata TaxID=136370 RepID=A0A5M8PBT5_9LECA|nr:MAG: hypothetical protein FRX48_09814 [Lasallia pustulata]
MASQTNDEAQILHLAVAITKGKDANILSAMSTTPDAVLEGIKTMVALEIKLNSFKSANIFLS